MDGRSIYPADPETGATPILPLRADGARRFRAAESSSW